MRSKTVILIICEGDSEYAYVQELNRFLNMRNSSVTLLGCNAGGGGFKSLRQVCRARKTRNNGRTFIFADADIYFRNDSDNRKMYDQEKAVLPPFLFQTWNFEDFLLMHFPCEVLEAWVEECRKSGHDVNPLHSKDYLPMFLKFCAKNQDILSFDFAYEKGDMPFSMNASHLRALSENGKREFPKSRFAEYVIKWSSN